MSTATHPSTFTQSLLAGGIAGTTVDLTLYPLDTLKTRIQSSAGFAASGGFRGVYAGIGSAVVGSAPGAALFFVTYEGTKTWLRRQSVTGAGAGAGAQTGDGITKTTRWQGPIEHMLAASIGETAACAIRVPTEVTKQRAQASAHRSSTTALKAILARRANGGLGAVWLELYRGWSITVLREVPFTIIQFPLWEALKMWVCSRRSASGVGEVTATGTESAACGAAAGAVAAAATTPLDVLKTRKMLATERTPLGAIAREVYGKGGMRAFFAGLGPRVLWISVGGGIFLGSYTAASNALGGVV